MATTSTWRLRAINPTTLEWGVTEVHFFQHTNCTGLLSVTAATASDTAGSNPQLKQIVRPSKAFDGSSFSYWKGDVDHCGDLWLAAELGVQSPGCVEVYQATGLNQPAVALELFTDIPPTADWRMVKTFSPLASCPASVGNCCPFFDNSRTTDAASGCGATMGVSQIIVPAFGAPADLTLTDTCPYPSYPPPSPPPPALPPSPGSPPAAPPGGLWISTTVPAGLSAGDTFEAAGPDGGKLLVLVPAGASAGDSIRVVATVVVPPAAPSPQSPSPSAPGTTSVGGVDGIVDSSADISGGDGDQDTSLIAGMGVALALLGALVLLMGAYICYTRRKYGRPGSPVQRDFASAQYTAEQVPDHLVKGPM